MSETISKIKGSPEWFSAKADTELHKRNTEIMFLKRKKFADRFSPEK